jgi:hypothetical protein
LAICALALLLTFGCTENDDSTCPIDYLSTVKMLTDATYAAGQSQVIWPLDDQYGEAVPPGIYMAHMCAGGNLSTIQFQILAWTDGAAPKTLPDIAKQTITSAPAPNGMYLIAYGGTYHPGDTIAFSFDLAQPARVRIGITGMN